ncbi:MAG: hypothetical protein HC799_09935 [Limnothrix sp. RL_2_0]|nr:hypothetical protein [Limnothrix sp. RL_2_0]
MITKPMDIAFNKHLQYQELKDFLTGHFFGLDFLLIYENVHSWDDLKPQQSIFQYMINQELSGGFKYGLDIALKSEEVLLIIEKLATNLSTYFNCSTICDASRVILKENNVFYSLLFEQGKVYLVDDYSYEETGQVTKIIELAYDYPQS